MTPSEQTVQRVYESVKNDEPAMAAECYSDDASYRDLAFNLKGKTLIAAMWRLVCSRRPKVEYESSDIRTEGSEVKGRWIFDYKFRGKHPVHNEMNSTFAFCGGKILVHHDEASRWAWSKQALGVPMAIVVTVLPILLRIQAKHELRKFMKNEGKG
jgi:SnoaL-like domain